MKNELYLVGGGGHCRSCIDVIEVQGRYRIAGIIDRPEKLDQENLGIRIMATDEDIERLVRKEYGFLVTIGKVGTTDFRDRVFASLKKLGAFLPAILSPRAHVSSHAHIGEGTIIMHGVTVNAAAIIGDNCIINSHALVEHDAHVADHCHISTGTVVNGGCTIGAGSFIGSNSVLTQGISVAAGVVVGAGSVVIRDINEAGTYVGNPCRRIR